jgi:hypothetical protein
MSEGYWEITEEFFFSSSKNNIKRVKTQSLLQNSKKRIAKNTFK